MSDKILKGAAVILRQKDSVLLTLRKAGDNIGTWELPAGHIEEGEDPVSTAMREVYEETNLVVTELQLVATFESTALFEAGSFAGELINREPDQHEVLSWCPATKLPLPQGPSLRYCVEHGLLG